MCSIKVKNSSVNILKTKLSSNNNSEDIILILIWEKEKKIEHFYLQYQPVCILLVTLLCVPKVVMVFYFIIFLFSFCSSFLDLQCPHCFMYHLMYDLIQYFVLQTSTMYLLHRLFVDTDQQVSEISVLYSTNQPCVTLNPYCKQ